METRWMLYMEEGDTLSLLKSESIPKKNHWFRRIFTNCYPMQTARLAEDNPRFNVKLGHGILLRNKCFFLCFYSLPPYLLKFFYLIHFCGLKTFVD